MARPDHNAHTLKERATRLPRSYPNRRSVRNCVPLTARVLALSGETDRVSKGSAASRERTRPVVSRQSNADRASARDREVKVGGLTTPALAWLVVGASMALGAAVVTGNTTKDPALAGTVGLVMGYVFSEAKAVLSYYFGNSADLAIASIRSAASRGDISLPWLTASMACGQRAESVSVRRRRFAR